MKLNNKFIYPPSTRSLVDGSRHYDVGDEKLPSVTTILSATQSEEKKQSLQRWLKREGKERAEGIRDQAANRGTIMHRVLEGYLTGQGHADLSDLGNQAGVMAGIVFKEGLKPHLEEYWGTELTVYYPGLYAGATDLAGVYNGRESIIDFKQSNKPKKREWIEDYFLQLAAYATAHNWVYNTQIDQGVVLMCTKDNYFQKFEVQGQEFQKYMWEWLRRVDAYYKAQNG